MVLETGLIKIKSLDGQICRARKVASREVQCESKDSFAYGSYRDFLGNKCEFLGVDAYK